MSSLKRALGLPMLCFYGTGMIVGAGIYSIIGKAAAQTGETLWLGFLLAGVCALLTALSYAELSTMFPKAGAEFVYLREAFKNQKWVGSTAGIAMAFSGAATAATVALAFSGYLNQFFESPQSLVALAVLLVFTGIAIIGIRASSWITVILPAPVAPPRPLYSRQIPNACRVRAKILLSARFFFHQRSPKLAFISSAISVSQ